jgi:dTDP-4-dehydrorhamnose reductase
VTIAAHPARLAPSAVRAHEARAAWQRTQADEGTVSRGPSSGGRAAGPIAITGARGRLARALTAAIDGDVIAWGRPELDLDDPSSLARLVERDRPRLVIHTAAMTDVDACAREPDLARRRNAESVASLARACRGIGSGLVQVSTNEVFDGERSDGIGYAESDPTAPRNAYGASKLEGEHAALAAFGDAPGLWIVRTAWLFGPPGNDFPDKIVAAADRLAPGEPLPVVADEHGSPTYTVDLAEAIVRLVERTEGGTFHLVADGIATRLDWAVRVLRTRRPSATVRPISRADWARASDPPPWAVLDGSRVAAAGISLRSWEDATDSYLRSLPPL